MTEKNNISCCGTDCSTCGLLGDLCIGCNEAKGRVFHVPEGSECPIYNCSRTRNGMDSCAECDKLPCEVILSTRDPNLSDEEFSKSVEERVNRLRGEA